MLESGAGKPLHDLADFNDKAKTALEILVLLTGADWATFRLPKESTPGLHLAAAAGSAALEFPPQRVVTESESISTAAFSESRIIVMDDYPAFPSATPVMIAMGVKSHRTDGTVEIVVADNGSGISPENFENIFEPLYTAKAQGTGLGLAICQEIINKHSGTISVDSEIGVGTTFRISISFAVKDESGSKIPISV